MYKQQSEKNFVFGTRAVIEAIRAGKEIDKVLIRKGLQNELAVELYQVLKEYDLPYQGVPVEKLNRVTMKNHQGVIAFLSAVEFTNIETLLPTLFEQGREPFILALDRITDIRNFGALCRSAECAGVDAIVIPEKGAAQLNSDAVKTSAGALLTLPVCRSKNMKQTLQFMKDSGLCLIGATEKTKNEYYKQSMKLPAVLLMGSEEDGILPEFLAMCDVQVRIPVLGSIESLNVSVAGGILLYEIVRQQRLNASK